MYGSVFMWVIIAIRNNVVWNVLNKAQYTMISDNATYIAIAHGISMTALWTWVSAEAWYDVETAGWDTGIWY